VGKDADGRRGAARQGRDAALVGYQGQHKDDGFELVVLLDIDRVLGEAGLPGAGAGSWARRLEHQSTGGGTA